MFPVTLEGTAAPTLMWAEERTIEPAALAQLRTMADLPWVHGVRVMPDVHVGKGATVGSVIAMRQAVAPAAVGVDIGCGMTAVRTDVTADDLPDSLRSLRARIERAVPVGFAMHEKSLDTGALSVSGAGVHKGWTRFWQEFRDLHPGVQSRESKAMKQIGTLGGGNHFIEVCLSDADEVWLMLHSGSRNIGKELAERHIAVARTLQHNQRLVDRDLAVFLAGTPEMDAYRHDLSWAQEYAARNRAVMLALIMQAFRDALPTRPVRFDDPISCHHNYVSEEVVDGETMLVTRKGAIRAGKGDLGLIPGSMGTGSYVVRGLGSELSFNSASHGAGRTMSRTKAKKRFTVDDLRRQTSGVESRKDAGVIDEIPAAYKDIEQVIDAQADLVEVVAHLRQVVCVKG
ncbi:MULTISPECIES: RtcB family protein [Rhodococcus]|jgi:tRNA-splicing ligase RtcB|uniref:3'-phosphate/5'-hydroxy nucleic acid ligase n=1 Tax=Rhodococcus oxybenzonivorans TaxID=1990687 RepID=A0AAE4V0V1_9NOCA|nr:MULTISPECIES: RtcB family protein [Rhodococcus]MDV7242766.1 RtcB family protein [Rhodococcus oxybenzonivorans]MDV7265653.1 RtcB family protein [Rhodococcus oxybenzonivorans]MDV7276199.1 RtcB family protein [Rhodococcus oxybenzonivorans]MDV7332254.1 RtcB family protein [Rhodococcus oxybenzonivorans]MDV7344459.1 RtcB family protein [Rhodococcus oxybenzonivorans]